MLIAGEWIVGQDKIVIRNPVDPDEIVGTAPCDMTQDAERAVFAVKAASMGQAEICQ